MYNEGMLKAGALKDKTIIVTGGGTGLGKSMGSYFCELGANLVIASRKIDVLKATADELQKATGAKVLPVACDVRKYDEVENLLKQSISTFGKVDVLVNDADGQFYTPY